MKVCFRIVFVCCAVAVGLSAGAGDPYDYKELTTTASHPVEVRKGLFDFGKDGIGWLEFHFPFRYVEILKAADVDARGETHSSLHANAVALAFGLVPATV